MPRASLRTWLFPLLLVGSLCLALYAFASALDALLLHHGALLNPVYRRIMPVTAADGRALTLAMVELLAGLVGLGFTVAAILVQLAASRYSSLVVDLFISHRTNVAFFTLSTVAPLYGFWVAITLDAQPWPTSHLALFSVVVSLNLLLLVPYINDLFTSLKPEAIIPHIAQCVRQDRVQGHPERVPPTQLAMVASLDQLADVALSSLHSANLAISHRAIAAMRDLVLESVQLNPHMPAAWFELPPGAFMGLSPSRRERLRVEHTWVEMYGARQLERIFVASLHQARELTAATAGVLREVGEAALRTRHEAARELCLLYFNTLLRHAMNAGDVRTLFHCMYQYRLLAEAHLAAGEEVVVSRIAFYFKYYGQECEKKDLSFVLEIVAFDLRRLVEQALSVRPAVASSLLDVLLEVDRTPESDQGEISQRGVRKTQILLAAWLLHRGQPGLADKIALDLTDERRERLVSLREELSLQTTAEFWEIQDRGANFYYVPPELRPHLGAFFDQLGIPPTEE